MRIEIEIASHPFGRSEQSLHSLNVLRLLQAPATSAVTVFADSFAAGRRPVAPDNLVFGHRGAIAPVHPTLHGRPRRRNPLSARFFVRGEDRSGDALRRRSACRRRVRHRPTEDYFNNVVATLGLLRQVARRGENLYFPPLDCRTACPQACRSSKRCRRRRLTRMVRPVRHRKRAQSIGPRPRPEVAAFRYSRCRRSRGWRHR